MVSQIRTLEELIQRIRMQGGHIDMGEPTHQQIAAKAEEIYQKRIAEKKPGDELSDWLEAEKELKEPVFRY